MTQGEEIQTAVHQEQLRLLSIGYLISGAMSAFFSLIGLVYAGLGIILTIAAGSDTKGAPPAFIGWTLALCGGLFFLLAVALALAKFRVAWCLQHRRSRAFCLVVAGITCLGIPYGTFLGICTFVVLGRPDAMPQPLRPEPEP